MGHSLGGMTVGLLRGARLTDTNIPERTSISDIDPRIKAGVLLAAPGNGGDSLTPFAAEKFSCLNPDFSTSTTAGGEDAALHLWLRGPEWYGDPFLHRLGGIGPGWWFFRPDALSSQIRSGAMPPPLPAGRNAPTRSKHKNRIIDDKNRASQGGSTGASSPHRTLIPYRKGENDV
ncbi:MAG: hypothetical protein AAF982_09040 [Pseudomonadota bacterium]